MNGGVTQRVNYVVFDISVTSGGGESGTLKCACKEECVRRNELKDGFK